MTTIEKPMLFSGPMVRAILENRKTQTRRIMKPQPHDFIHSIVEELHPFAPSTLVGTPAEGINVAKEERVFVAEDWCKNIVGVIGKAHHPVGSRIWVKETWRVRGGREYEYQQHQPSVVYRASVSDFDQDEWRPSIFMPRWASRIDLEVTAVKVERLQDISEEDARAEGVEEIRPLPSIRGQTRGKCWKDYGFGFGFHQAKQSYRSLWESINGPGSWDLNPWVWVYTFRRVKP